MKTMVQASVPLLSQPKKALVASNQKADEDSYLPSAISPGCAERAVIPLAFARKTASFEEDTGVYGTRGDGPYT